MKIVVIFAIALTVLEAYAVSLRQIVAQQPIRSAVSQQESPFFCDRRAIDPEHLQRKAELGKTLHSLKRSTRELSDGYEFELPSDPATVQAAAEWAAMERLCCPFFDIELRLEREHGPFWLRLTGRDGVKQFIHSEFGPWMAGGGL